MVNMRPVHDDEDMTPVSSPRRLHRSSSEHVLGGVCGGLAEYFDIDPAIVRIGAVVIAFMGGTGVFAYIGAWIFLPLAGPVETHGRNRRHHGGRVFRNHRDRRKIIGAALLGLGALNLLDRVGLGFRSDVSWPLALIGIGAAVLWSRRHLAIDGSDQSAVEHGPSSFRHRGGYDAAVGNDPTNGDPFGERAAPEQPTRDPLLIEADRLNAELNDVNRMAEERLQHGRLIESASAARTTNETTTRATSRHLARRSAIGPIGLGAILLSGGFATALTQLNIVRISPRGFLAIALMMIGASLVVGTWLGRPRGFVFLGIVLAGALATTTLFNIEWGGEVGQVTAVPVSRAALLPRYHLFAGQLGLDLRQLDLTGQTADVAAEVGFGELVVLVPDRVRVEVDGSAGTGEMSAFGATDHGLRPKIRQISEGRSRADGVLRLHVRVGAGQVEVARGGELRHTTFPRDGRRIRSGDQRGDGSDVRVPTTPGTSPRPSRAPVATGAPSASAVPEPPAGSSATAATKS